MGSILAHCRDGGCGGQGGSADTRLQGAEGKTHGAWGMGQKMEAEGGGQRAEGEDVERRAITGAVIASRVVGGAAISCVGRQTWLQI